MSDPFWDDLDKTLPQVHRGEPGWAHQRGKVMSLLRAGGNARQRVAALVAAGAFAAALAVVLRERPVQISTPPIASMPTDDLEFLETAPLLENLDELQDATELDRA